MQGLLEAARKFVGLFSETPEKLELRFNPPGTAGFPPTTVTRHDEERILLELVCEHGYGEWRKIRSDFRSRPEFQFDWFLKSLVLTRRLFRAFPKFKLRRWRPHFASMASL